MCTLYWTFLVKGTWVEIVYSVYVHKLVFNLRHKQSQNILISTESNGKGTNVTAQTVFVWRANMYWDIWDVNNIYETDIVN